MKMLLKSALSVFLVLAVHLPAALRAQNLALGKPVTASSNMDAVLYPNAHLTDGDFSTFAHTNNTANPPNAEWLRVDLGADYYIDSIVIGCQPGSNRTRRFMLVTWPQAQGSGLGGNPYSYLNAPLYNRLIYTDGTGVVDGSAPFGGNSANPNVPGTAGQTLGPAFVNDRLQLNIGVHKARYVMILNLQDDYLDPTELQVYASAAPPVRAFTNGGFDQVPLQFTTFMQVREGNLSGWSTTEMVAMHTSDNTAPLKGSFIELWRSGYGGIPSYSGSYFAELNAFSNGLLEQRPICVRAGETFSYSFAHRGRSGVDVMRLRIDDVDVAEFSDSNAQGGTHSFTVLSPSNTTVTQDPTTAAGWTKYSGTWVNNSGTGKVVTFAYYAVSTATGGASTGNFLDEVSLGNLSPTVSFNRTTSLGQETTPQANLPRLLLNGMLSSPESIQLRISGGTATRGSDYTTTPDTGIITVVIPAGNYDGTEATGINLAPYIRINADLVSPEPDETIFMTLQNPSGNIIIADSNSCTLPIFNTVYTIQDVTPPLAVNDSLNHQTPGSAATLPNILVNDSDPNGGTLVPENISLVPLQGATATVTDAQGDITGFNVPGEGSWTLNSSTGALTFTPQTGFTGDPTPIYYTVRNSAGARSDTAMIKIDYNAPIPLSGTVYQDANGDTIDGIPTDAGGTLRVILVNEAGNVVIAVPVNAAGQYMINDIVPGNYNLRLNTVSGTAGQPAPPVSLPPGWTNTAEGLTPVGDSIADSRINVRIDTSAVTHADFAIERLPESYAVTRAITGAPVLTNLGAQPLQGSDPEDLPAQGSWSGRTFVIDTLPTNGYILKYNGAAVVAGNPIANYNPALLTIEPGATSGGTATTTFKYSTVDAAGKKDPTPAAYRINWSIALPVQLQRFSGRATKDCNVVLSWSTGKEERLEHFAVQRGKDGVHFETIALQAPKGSNSNYQYTDAQNGTAVSYYRLYIKDLDQGETYSDVVPVGTTCNTTIAVYPNPASDKVLINGLSDDTELKVTNVLGAIVLKTVLHTGQTSLDIATLAAGTYYFVFTTGGQVQTLKVLKK